MAEHTLAMQPLRAMAARAVIAAGVATATGQQSLTAEIVSGCFVVAAAAAGPFIVEWFRHRRTNRTGDALAKALAEQARLLGEVEARDETIRKLRSRRRG